MAVEFKITDAIDKSIVEKLQSINAELRQAKQNVTGVMVELSKNINFKVDGIDDLIRKQQMFSQAVAAANKEQDKIVALQGEAKAVYQQVADKLSVLAKSVDGLSVKMDSYAKLVRRASDALGGLKDAQAQGADATRQVEQAMQRAGQAAGMASKEYEEIVSTLRTYDSVVANANKAIATQKVALAGVRSTMSNLKKEYSQSTMSLDEYSSKMGELQRREQEIKASIQQEEALLRNHAKVIVSASGSYHEMNAAMLELEKRFKSLGKAEREGAVGQGMLSDIERLNKELKEIDAQMGNYQRNIGNYESALGGLEDKLKSVLGLNNEFGDSIIALAKNNEGNIFQNLKDGVSSFGDTLSGLLKNRAFLAIGGIAGVGMAVKWWYDYNKGLKEATRLTQQFTGLSGDALKSYRSDIQTLADTYNKDFVEVLRSVNSLSKQFGVNQTESLQIVRDGFIAGADASGEYLDILREYPAYFKEAGISAEAFVAITAQTAKEGIFSDKGVDTIKEANIRLREMTDATAQALDGIGISSKKVQEELQNGSATTFEIMQRVSQRLSELPDSASAVGTAIADIFGGPGEDAGLQYIRTLKDIELNLGKVKKAAGALGEAEEELLDSQSELCKEIAYMFDMTGGSFETLEAKVKSFFNTLLAGFIRGVREGIEGIGDLFRTQESIDVRTRERAEYEGKGLFDTKEIEKEKAAIEKLAQSNIESGMNEEEAYKKAIDSRKKNVQGLYDYVTKLQDKYQKSRDKATENMKNANSSFFPWVNRANLEKAKKDWNEAQGMWYASIQQQGKLLAQMDYINSYSPESATTKKTDREDRNDGDEEKEYYKKINEDLAQIQVEGIKNRYERERAEMRAEHDKNMAEITGNTEKEIALRKELDAKLERDLAKSTANEGLEVERKDLDNRLAAVEEGSKEELDLRLRLLDNQKRQELMEAEETGANVLAIEKKYENARLKELEGYAAKAAEVIANRSANESLGLQASASEEIKKVTMAYTQGAMKREEYEAEVLRIQQKYARASIDLAIKSVEEQLNVANLSPEDRARLEEELSRLKIQLSDEETQVMLENDRKQKESIEKKKQAVMDYMSKASEALNAISGLANAIFEGRIQQIEDEQDANEEAGEKEQERIEELESSGVLTKEQAEARKRAAEAKTEAKSEELEKKKAALQRKQAIWDKANQLAQASIATALAVTRALPNLVLAALVGAMGAVQIATIMATPIPKYAKGTDYHPGGLAVVGDGGEHELVQTSRGAWLTPDVPTLVELPKGATVVPDIDVDKILMKRPFLDVDKLQSEAREQGIVVLERGNDYDYSRLEGKIDKLAKVMERGFKANERQMKDAAYREYIRRKM